MLVVPDNTTAKKVPSVEGMIVYRKDKNKLYVQGDKKMSALAEEKKVDITFYYISRGESKAQYLHEDTDRLHEGM